MGFFQEGWWRSVPPVMLVSFIPSGGQRAAAGRAGHGSTHLEF